jgi:hypothetical protein
LITSSKHDSHAIISKAISALKKGGSSHIKLVYHICESLLRFGENGYKKGKAGSCFVQRGEGFQRDPMRGVTESGRWRGPCKPFLPWRGFREF